MRFKMMMIPIQNPSETMEIHAFPESETMNHAYNQNHAFPENHSKTLGNHAFPVQETMQKSSDFS